jgi:hypothetical protein
MKDFFGESNGMSFDFGAGQHGWIITGSGEQGAGIWE